MVGWSLGTAWPGLAAGGGAVVGAAATTGAAVAAGAAGLAAAAGASVGFAAGAAGAAVGLAGAACEQAASSPAPDVSARTCKKRRRVGKLLISSPDQAHMCVPDTAQN